MATYFKNPQNGYIEKATGFGTFIWAFLFGPFYFMAKGHWGHAFLYIGVAIALVFATGSTAGMVLVWLVYACAAYGIVQKGYLRKGWIQTNPEHEAKAYNTERAA